MTTNAWNQALIDKLQKVANLLDNAGTPGEAEAAAAALSRLLLKYNLDEADVRAAQGSAAKSHIVVRPITITPGKSAAKWQWLLLNTIARHNFTQLVKRGGSSNAGWIAGTNENIDAVLDLNARLSIVFKRLASESWKAQPPHTVYFTTRAKYIHGFLLGVPAGLSERFRLDRKQDEEADRRVSALVVTTERQLSEAVAAELGRTTHTGRRSTVDGRAYDHGRAAGKNYREHGAIGRGSLALGRG